MRKYREMLLQTVYLILLIGGFCYSASNYAEEVTQGDVSSAYNYFASPPSGTATIPPPTQLAPKQRTDAGGGFGGVANNLMQPVEITSAFLSGGAIVIGVTCLFAGFIRYLQYRVNPLAYPIGTVVTLFVLGIVLLLLPLIYKLTESGIPFSLSG